MKVLIDTNIVLDVLLARHPFVKASAAVFGLAERSEMTGILCATTVTTIDYLLTQSLSKTESRKALRSLLELFEIAAVNRPVIEEALKSRVADFEDAVLEQAALQAEADFIVTRNAKDFRASAVSALDPESLLAMLQK